MIGALLSAAGVGTSLLGMWKQKNANRGLREDANNFRIDTSGREAELERLRNQNTYAASRHDADMLGLGYKERDFISNNDLRGARKNAYGTLRGQEQARGAQAYARSIRGLQNDRQQRNQQQEQGILSSIFGARNYEGQVRANAFGQIAKNETDMGSQIMGLGGALTGQGMGIMEENGVFGRSSASPQMHNPFNAQQSQDITGTRFGYTGSKPGYQFNGLTPQPAVNNWRPKPVGSVSMGQPYSYRG